MAHLHKSLVALLRLLCTLQINNNKVVQKSHINPISLCGHNLLSKLSHDYALGSCSHALSPTVYAIQTCSAFVYMLRMYMHLIVAS